MKTVRGKGLSKKKKRQSRVGAKIMMKKKINEKKRMEEKNRREEK